MRILILGAGGIGGYYGGRLAEAGADVTFLVRPGRAAALAANGLVVRSPRGDIAMPVRTVTREAAGSGYDLVILSCKAYDLEDAIATIAPATPGAHILPLLNGMRHLDRLDAAFGADNVLGGVAAVGVTMDPDGTIRHLSPMHNFTFGARSAAAAGFCAALEPVIAKGAFDSRLSTAIMHDMWEKWVFLATLAGMTCLLRGDIGTINRTSPSGQALLLEALEECSAVAAAAGFAPRPGHVGFSRKMLMDATSTFAASMLRDLQGGGRVEADHVVGDMLGRALAAGRPATLLRAAYAHLKVYEESLA
jgi:2-dehydropantoate 2-reductase